MHCRTDSNAQVIGSAAAISGAPLHVVEKAFGALYRQGLRHNATTPDTPEVAGFLHSLRETIKDANGVAENVRLLRKVGLSQVREQVEAGDLPDGPTWFAWEHLLAEATERAAIERRPAAIFDIDGTLSDNAPMAAVPFPVALPGEKVNFDEWMSHTVDLDVNEWVRDATHEVSADTVKVIITARNEKYHDMTVAWLARHNVAYDILIMRPNHDQRPDHDYKQQVLDELERTYDFAFAMDDNPHVAQMWRDNGIETIVVPGYETVHAPDPSQSAPATA